MANDDESIMQSFKDFVSTRSSLIAYYEMDAEQIADFNTNILRVERNPNPKEFPDFIGKLMDVEVFNVTSSFENGSIGAVFSIENNALKKRMEEALKLPDDPEERKKGRSYSETLEYTGHSYDYWIYSLRRNIQNHKESRLKYSLHEKKESAFIAYELDGLIDYFILFNEMNSEAEVFPINKIPSCLSKLTLDCDFYPREGAGMICIGLSDTTEPISFS